MPRTTIMAAALLLIGCTSEPILLENTGRTVSMTGAPAKISSTAQGIDYFQPHADAFCQQNGYRRGQTAGSSTTGFVETYTFSCTND